MTISNVLRFSGLLILTPVWGFAAGPEKGDAVVQEVLAREATVDVPDRAALLRGVLTQSPKLAAAQWAAGRIDVAGTWQPFADRVHESSADPMLAEYRTLRDEAELTSVRHRELARWCDEHGLVDQERAHLWALLSEDANQPELWRRLGYHQFDGQWLTAEEERELERRWQQRQRDYKRWLPKAENFAKRLSDSSPIAQASAREQLRNLDDTSALSALETTLCTQSPELALEFVAWAKRLDRVETTLALARQAIVTPWDGVRNIATDVLRSRRLEHFAPAVLAIFSSNLESLGEATVRPRGQRGEVLYAQQFVREFRDHVQVYRVMGLHLPATPETIQLGVRRDRLATPDGAARLGKFSNFATANNLRVKNDLARSIEDQKTVNREEVERINQQIDELNARCSHLLSATSGETAVKTPQEWWSWWAKHSTTEMPQAQKTVVEVQEIEVIPSAPEIRITINPSCLPAGTPVFTELGPKPIETLQIGDRVLAKDIDTGEIAFRPVLRTTVRSPQPLVKLGLRSETIQATRGHHFWVSGKGWRMARELQPGDRLHGLNGTVSVTDVATGDTAPVYNLVVDRTNTYFVGDSLVLSHDVTSPAPTNVKVPGLK